MPTQSALADRGRLGSRRRALRRRSGQARVRRIACQISLTLTQTKARPASTGRGGVFEPGAAEIWTSGNRSLHADLCILRGCATAAKGSQRHTSRTRRSPLRASAPAPCAVKPNFRSLIWLRRSVTAGPDDFFCRIALDCKLLLACGQACSTGSSKPSLVPPGLHILHRASGSSSGTTCASISTNASATISIGRGGASKPTFQTCTS